MTEHTIIEEQSRWVESKLDVDDSGYVQDEEIINVGAPQDSIGASYHCTCGEDFGGFETAMQHIRDVRDSDDQA